MKYPLLLMALLVVASSCASQPPAASTQPVPMLAAPPPLDPNATLTLDQIEPVPVLAQLPTTQPTNPVPDAALELYAKGLADMADRHPYLAVDDYHDALKSDPNSPDLYVALGRAELDRLQIPSDQSFAAFEQASTLRPNNLDVQLLLGREYLVVENFAKSLLHLRLAKQTDDYLHNAPGSGAVELYLGRVLERLGYLRAALDEYVLLKARLAHPARDLWADPETAFVVNNPPLIELQIASLHERLREYEPALEMYDSVSKQDPANFPLQAKIVQVLVLMNRPEDAIARAAHQVETFQANSDSLALLHDTCRAVGPKRELEVLEKLHDANPGDRGILFALVDALVTLNRADEAQSLLAQAAAANPNDDELLRKLFDFYVSRGDTSGAARLLVLSLAANPDSVGQINPMLGEIVRPMRNNALRLSQLQKLNVPESAQAARLYLLSVTADLWHRDALAHSSIEQAVRLSPAFAPAYRRFISDLWARPQLSTDRKIEANESLAQDAEKKGNPAMAAEARGLSLMYQRKIPEAAQQLQQAIALGGRSSDLQLTYAAVLGKLGKSLQCEQALWQLIAEQPRFQAAWNALYSYYDNTNRKPDAIRVLERWLQTDPGSPDARILEAIVTGEHGQAQMALARLARLFADHSDDLPTIMKLESAYVQLNHVADFLAQLVQLHHEQPTNLTLVSLMVDIAAQAHRPAEAVGVLGETRKAVGNDADLLYQLATLYHEVGQDQTCEDLLGRVLEIDPANVPASNDLGFDWADSGKNLEQAEKMIRVAVDAEPDNRAFLDSLGWVLYKRGKFAEAIPYFQQAVDPANVPEPEIHDHFGDVLYRAGRIADAQAQWQRALGGLAESRESDDSTNSLRQSIQQKLRELSSKRPADVAPVAAPDTQPSATQP